MTDESGVSRRQALKYGGLAAAVPLLAGARPAKAASLSGNSSRAQQVTHQVTQHAAPAQLALAADEAVDVRASRGGRGIGLRCQLQLPSIRDHIDQTANVHQTGNVRNVI
jgi:hypothetical protein